MGVGSEVFGAVINGRKGVGIELKPSYFKQAVRNCNAALTYSNDDSTLFHGVESTEASDASEQKAEAGDVAIELAGSDA